MPKIQQTHIDKLLMLLYLVSLRPRSSSRLLATSHVPSSNEVFAHLLRTSCTQTTTLDGSSSKSSPLVSQTATQGGSGRHSQQCPQCTYCNQIGDIPDWCYQCMNDLLTQPTLPTYVFH